MRYDGKKGADDTPFSHFVSLVKQQDTIRQLIKGKGHAKTRRFIVETKI